MVWYGMVWYGMVWYGMDKYSSVLSWVAVSCMKPPVLSCALPVSVCNVMRRFIQRVSMMHVMCTP